MKKKYYLMYEMHHSVNFSSSFTTSLDEWRNILESLKSYPFIERLAVGFWEEIPREDGGNLKIFNICFESRMVLK